MTDTDTNIDTDTERDGDQERDPLRSFKMIGEPFEKWDIGFDINAEILGNIMGFMGPFNDNVPIKFFADRLSIRQTNEAKVAYVEIDIPQHKLQNYEVNIGNIESDDKSKGEPHKLVMMSASDVTDEVLSYVTKESMITVRIDSKYRKSIQFSTSGGYSVWTRLIDLGDEVKRLDTVRLMIDRVRNNSSFPKAVLTFDADTFKKMCILGAKAKDKTEFLTMQIDKEKGLTLYSESNTMGRVLRIGCAGGTSGAGDAGGIGSASDVGGVSNVGLEKTEYSEYQSYGGYEDDDSGDDSGNDYTDVISGSNIMGDMGIDKSKSGGNKKSKKGGDKDDGKKDRYKKGKDENTVSTVASKLYQLDMNKDFVDIIFNREYLAPMLKLKGMGFVVMEVREKAPIIIEQELYDGCKVFLTIAPRTKED